MKQWISLALVAGVIGGGVWAGKRVESRALPTLQWQESSSPRGVFHVHSEASHDSEVSVATIAQTAAALGLSFVILTDHNNQQAPVEVDGVTLLSFAELSTKNGHVIQFGLPTLLDREQKNSFDIGPMLHKQNASTILAHPTDLKRPWVGRWRDHGGLEIASLSASARRRGGPTYLGLLPGILTWPINRQLALTQLYDRDHKALRRWDETSNPGQVGLCGVDAHGRVDLFSNLQLWQLHLEDPLPVDFEKRSVALQDAIRQGRFFCAAALFGDSPEFVFEAINDQETIASAGDSLRASEVSELLVRAPTVQFPEADQRVSIVLFRNGDEVIRHHGKELRYKAPRPGLYRAEIRMPIPNLLFGYRTIPLIYSNRIKLEASE